VTPRGQVTRHRRPHERPRGRVPAVGVTVGVVVGFFLGAVADAVVTVGGWEAVTEDLLSPLLFALAVVCAFVGGFLLLAAEHAGDRASAWRAAAVYVASAVLASVVFWGAL
jgi:hypothetical protein